MGRPQFGFPRLRVVTGREAGIAMSPDDTPPSYGADNNSPACMKKAPGQSGAFLHSYCRGVLCESGDCGSEFLDGDLLFRAEPIFLLVTVLATACLVEFVRA
jgi:hypothetical protein